MTNTNVTIGQIWEDKDKRRAGRTFKIKNIDLDGTVTCENITSVGEKKPLSDRLISFIALKRFKTSKYYSLKQDIVSITNTSKEKTFVVDVPVIKRESRYTLVDECLAAWPNDKWEQAGPFAVLTMGHCFDVLVRKTRQFPPTYDVQLKINRFTLHRITNEGSLDQIFDDIIKLILGMKQEIELLIGADNEKK